MSALVALLVLAAVPLTFWCGYLALLTAASWLPQRRPIERDTADGPRFDVIVPAHNEGPGIAQTVHSLKAMEYPEAARRIIVVADNCEDDTAARAIAAGALVLERRDADRRGKGYALDFAFARSASDGFADAVVVVDADTRVSPNLLRAFARRLAGGAHAIQASYGVSNPEASWRTRLMRIALALFNDLRSQGRDRLGWSSGLKGNGMCFSHRVLKQVPHQAYSRVEDLEYGLRLGQAGHRVHYASEAQVLGEMVSSARAARSQRRRWEGGRWQLTRAHALPLLKEGFARRDGMLLDLAFDLLSPPLSYVALEAVGLTLAAGAAATSAPERLGWLIAWVGLCDAALVLYVLRGCWLSKVGPRGLLDLLWAPVFVVWKLSLLVSRPEHPKGEWVRTTREGEVGGDGN